MYLGCNLGGAKLEHRCPYPEVNSIQAKHVWTQDLAQVLDFEPWKKFSPTSKSGLKYLNWAWKPESKHAYIINITLTHKTWLCLIYHVLYAYNISQAWAWIWQFNFTHMLWLWLSLIIHMQFGLSLSLVTIHPILSELHCWSLDLLRISPTVTLSRPIKVRHIGPLAVIVGEILGWSQFSKARQWTSDYSVALSRILAMLFKNCENIKKIEIKRE